MASIRNWEYFRDEGKNLIKKKTELEINSHRIIGLKYIECCLSLRFDLMNGIILMLEIRIDKYMFGGPMEWVLIKIYIKLKIQSVNHN